MAQFNELKEDMKSFTETVTTTLTSAMEMLNPTEQNKVPQEMSKEQPKEELSKAEPVVHSPEEGQKKVNMQRVSPGRKRTTQDRVFEQLFGADADTSVFEQ